MEPPKYSNRCNALVQPLQMSLKGTLLGGSRVVTSRVISPLTGVINIVLLLITSLITNPGPLNP